MALKSFHRTTFRCTREIIGRGGEKEKRVYRDRLFRCHLLADCLRWSSYFPRWQEIGYSLFRAHGALNSNASHCLNESIWSDEVLISFIDQNVVTTLGSSKPKFALFHFFVWAAIWVQRLKGILMEHIYECKWRHYTPF